MKKITAITLSVLVGIAAYAGGGKSGAGSDATDAGDLGGVIDEGTIVNNDQASKVILPLAQLEKSVSGYDVRTGAEVGNVSIVGYGTAGNAQIFNQYCIGNAAGISAVAPNYTNQDVRRAAKILSRVTEIGTKAVIEYGAIGRMYQSAPPAPIDGVTISKTAHNFLSQLCGEFRDRASMIQEKIRWVHNTILLPDEDKKQVSFDMNGNPWKALSTQGYKRYIGITNQVWDAKQARLGSGYITIGNSSGQAQKAVDGFTVCETKYIISTLVPNKNYSFSASAYFSGYNSFQSQCTSDDKDYYYDFRGDSNLKAHSPEANAMIWHSISIAKQCETMDRSKGALQNQDCINYYSKPFESRFKAARAGLASWLMRTDAQGNVEGDGYSSPNISGWINPVFDFKLLSTRPFPYSKNGNLTTEPLFFNVRMDLPDFGINDLFAKDPGALFKRIRDAVDRHTNWYQSGYRDGFATSATDNKGHYREQAYSPFVASSYEMSKSDAFTAPGYTVKTDGDGQKQWMFVFKIHKSNWYRADDLQAGRKVDFDRMWIDETSFGIEGLADAERAWDRMGTATEGELDSILYLHNMDAAGNTNRNDEL